MTQLELRKINLELLGIIRELEKIAVTSYEVGQERDQAAMRVHILQTREATLRKKRLRAGK